MKALECSRSDGIVIVRFTRPARMNLIDEEFVRHLGEAVAEVEGDPAARAVVLTGGGEAPFCAGADLSQEPLCHFAPEVFSKFLAEVNRVLDRIESLSKPAVAAIGGVALGGGLELALVCDVRIAAEGAKLGLPEIKIGAIPLAGGTQRLPRLVGLARAKEMLLTGEPIDARAALAAGLVSEVVAAADLVETAGRWAGRLARGAPLALGAIKRALLEGLGKDLPGALEIEREIGMRVLASEDFREGVSAFLGSRRPVFRGR